METSKQSESNVKSDAASDDVFPNADVKKEKVEQEGGLKKTDTVSSSAQLLQNFPEEEFGGKSGSKTKYTVQKEKTLKENMISCKILLLDGLDIQVSIDKKATGQVLFEKVCDQINLLEKDYFSLTFRENNDVRVWIQHDKQVCKQIKKGAWVFSFEVKFYPHDPTLLHEEITRYQVYLQIRVDILSGKLPCSFVTQSLLGSYAVQSQLGDFDADAHGPGFDYIKSMHFTPGQNEELMEKIAELHRTNRGQRAMEAELNYLQNAKNLAIYGIHQHPALTSGGVDANEEVNVGVCAAGIVVYKQRIRTNRFIWVKILKIAYKRNRFIVTTRPDAGEGSGPKTYIYRLGNPKAAKRLWRLAVEHHTFFRLREAEAGTRGVFSRKASRYYAGRTQYQSQQATDQIQRPEHDFNRVYYTAGRFTDRKKSLDGAGSPGYSTERSEETLPDYSYRTMTLDLKKRDKFSVSYADMDADGMMNDISHMTDDERSQMVPVTDANGRIVYVKRSHPSASSEVFLAIPGGGRRPSQDDYSRTGDRTYDNSCVTLVVNPSDGTSGVTYSKTPYPTGPGYLTPGGGPGLTTPGGPGSYGTFNSQGGYLTPGGNGMYGGTGSPYYGTDDLHRQHGGLTPDDPGFYQNSQSMARYGGSATPGTAGSRQMLDEHGNVIVTKNIYITTMERSRTGRSIDGDDIGTYQDDHLKQHGYNLGVGGDGTWGGPGYSNTTKTMTRTYTAPDGTIVTEHRTEKNGVVETHIEKRTQIVENEGDMDYDKALAEAIRSVTDMNPDLSVEKIEIQRRDED